MHERIKLLLGNKQFSLLWIALTQSQFGTLLNLVALSLFIFDKTHSGAAVGLLEIAMAIPSILIGIFAGVVVDRYNRKWIMVISDVIRGFLFLAIGFIPNTQFIYLFVFSSSLASLFHSPAYFAILPNIIKKDLLSGANSFTEMSSQFVRITAPGLAGICYIQFGFTFICIFNCATYLLSAIIITFINIPQAEPYQQHSSGLKAILADVSEGFRMINSNHFAKWVLFVYGGLQLGAGAIVILMVVFVKEALGGSDMDFGMVMSATAIGSFLGAALSWFRGKLTETTILRISLISLGISVMLTAISSVIWLALSLFGIIGVMQTALSISINTLMQKYVANELLGRTFAAMGTIAGVSQLLSMGLGGFMADVVGIRTVYMIGGAIILSTAILASCHVNLPTPTEEAAI